MATSLLELAASLREAAATGEVVLARLPAIGVDISAMRRQQAHLAEAGQLLLDLAPHDRLVRSLVAVGALVDFPAFSSKVDHIAAGSIVLMRGMVAEPYPYPGEALVQVVLAAHRLSNRVLIGRGDIVGIERREPPAGVLAR